MGLEDIIRQIEEARKALEPPFLALPEHGWSPGMLAYRRGARDAYAVVLAALKTIPGEEESP